MAGLKAAQDLGLIGRAEEVVAVVTGTGLKTAQFFRTSGRVAEIQGTLEEVAQVLR